MKTDPPLPVSRETLLSLNSPLSLNPDVFVSNVDTVFDGICDSEVFNDNKFYFYIGRGVQFGN